MFTCLIMTGPSVELRLKAVDDAMQTFERAVGEGIIHPLRPVIRNMGDNGKDIPPTAHLMVLQCPKKELYGLNDDNATAKMILNVGYHTFPPLNLLLISSSTVHRSTIRGHTGNNIIIHCAR
jgi:hypothetical protein